MAVLKKDIITANNKYYDRIDHLLDKFIPRWKRITDAAAVAQEDGTTNVEGDNKQTKDEEEQEEEQQQSTMKQSPISMALFFLLAIEVIMVVVMESFIIYYHTMIFAQCHLNSVSLGLSQADLIYHGILIIAPIYQVFLYMDTLRQRNIFQLLTLILFGLLLVVLAGIQTMQHMLFENVGCNLSSSFLQSNNSTLSGNNSTTSSSHKPKMFVMINGTAPSYKDNIDAGVSNIRPFEYSLLGVIAIGFVLLLACSIKLYHLFRWNHYFSHRFHDTMLRNTLRSWAILSGLIKVDAFYLFAYAVQLVPAVLIGYTSILPFESVLVFAVNLIALLVAIYALQNELMVALMMFNVMVLGSIGYFGYRLFTFGIPRPVTSDPFLLTRYSLLFTTLALILLMILTLCTGLECVRNVWIKKVRILDKFTCVCPTCYMHSSLVGAITADNLTTIQAASSSTVMSSPSHNLKGTLSSLDLEIVPVKQ